MNSNFVTHARSDNLYNNSKSSYNNRVDVTKYNNMNMNKDNNLKDINYPKTASTLSILSYSQRMS